jgi:hypothetical protein
MSVRGAQLLGLECAHHYEAEALSPHPTSIRESEKLLDRGRVSWARANFAGCLCRKGCRVEVREEKLELAS